MASHRDGQPSCLFLHSVLFFGQDGQTNGQCLCVIVLRCKFFRLATIVVDYKQQVTSRFYAYTQIQPENDLRWLSGSVQSPIFGVNQAAWPCLWPGLPPYEL